MQRATSAAAIWPLPVSLRADDIRPGRRMADAARAHFLIDVVMGYEASMPKVDGELGKAFGVRPLKGATQTCCRGRHANVISKRHSRDILLVPREISTYFFQCPS